MITMSGESVGSRGVSGRAAFGRVVEARTQSTTGRGHTGTSESTNDLVYDMWWESLGVDLITILTVQTPGDKLQRKRTACEPQSPQTTRTLA
jgi:hypothetical protein